MLVSKSKQLVVPPVLKIDEDIEAGLAQVLAHPRDAVGELVGDAMI